MSSSLIQRTIISNLKNARSLRYHQLQPESVDRDLFNYHLRELVKKGIITKVTPGEYQLSAKGRKRVADVQSTSDQSDRLFKINVLLIVIDRRADGLYVLNQRRTSQPSYGIVGVPGGTIVKAEPLLEGASRKLLEETGVTAHFEYIATTRRIVYESGTLFSDVMFPICLASNHSGQPITTQYGDNFWVPIDEAIQNDSQRADHIEAISAVLMAIRSGELETVRGRYDEQILHLESM